jgi:hypothetical protein
MSKTVASTAAMSSTAATWPQAASTSRADWSLSLARSPTTCVPARMVRAPHGVFAKVRGLGATFRALTRVLLLRRGKAVGRDGCLYVS